MTALVHLVRHASHAELGQVLSGRSEIALNDEGRREAMDVGKALARRKPTVRAIHSSPRRRTMETAELIAAEVGLAPIAVDALDEIDFGGWTGRRFAALAADPLWQAWNKARSNAAPPGGERMDEVVQRVMRHIADVASSQGDACIFVTHCDVIRGVVAHCLGLSMDRILNFDVYPASISTVSVEAGGGRVVCVNERVP